MAEKPTDFAYRRVADAMMRHIADSEMKPGDRLPTLPEIQDQYDVSSTTARKAVDELRLKGIVESRQGSGLFVAREPSREDLAASRDLGEILRAMDAIEERIRRIDERVAAVEARTPPAGPPAARARQPKRSAQPAVHESAPHRPKST